MNHDHDPQQNRIAPVIIILVTAAAILWIWLQFAPSSGRDETATPRAITPRGDLANDERNSIDVFEAISPSVVYITNVTMRRDRFNLDVHAIPKGSGSGFIWDEEGRIVTNFHVIQKANRVEVTLSDNTTWKADVIGVAPDRDLAVLKIDAPGGKLRPIPVGDSRNLLVGQKVYAIGNPFGLDQTMTSGIVSALGREISAVTGRKIQGVIQTDAAINPGNSGGPLLDSAGRLIGVNTAIFSPSGVSAGIGFAVPVEAVNRIVPELIRHGRITKPGLGVTIAHGAVARQLGIESGVLITGVNPGTGAAEAGLQATARANGKIVLGDIITGVNGDKVTGFDRMRDILDKYKVGDVVNIEIVREGAKLEVAVRLSEIR